LRDDGASRDDHARVVRATILCCPPMLEALVRRSSGSPSIEVGSFGTLPVAVPQDEQSLTLALEQADAVALTGQGVLVVGRSLDTVLNQLERLELNAKIEMAVRRNH